MQGVSLPTQRQAFCTLATLAETVANTGLGSPSIIVVGDVARAALLRQESRGGHTRDDYPTMDPAWRQKLLVCSGTGDGPVKVEEEATSTMRDDLIRLFRTDELKKYLTPQELEAIPE